MNSIVQYMRRFLISIWMFVSGVGWAQIQEDFSDGNFTSNPTWSGSDSIFVINSGRLKLQAYPVAAKAFLSTPGNAIHNASWEFYVQMDFNPSSTNYCRVYLVANNPDLTQPLNGYYVMVGNTTDEISLYRQTGTTVVKIIDGLDARVNLTTVSVKIKVTRDASANWQLFSDVGSTGIYTEEGIAINDPTYTVSSHMGVQCTYTATRSDKFWFDDFIVTGTPVPDLTPPALVSVQATNQNNLLVNFSEVIDPVTAQAGSNYSVNKNIGSPSTVVLQADNKSIILILTTPLINGLIYSLQASGIRDTDGNAMLPTSLDFLYFIPQPIHSKDIIVSEFMADPSPVVGLPESEFVELFNRSPNPVDLQNWKLSDGTTTASLPSHILMPDSRCVVVPTSVAAFFSGSLSVSNFPSLNNTGDNIILKSPGGITIDSITYSLAWYHSDEKKDGGWSLEIVDPENLCEEDGNWTASENVQGGTPGIQNSVFASNPDVTAPLVESAIIVSPTRLEITFNEKLDGSSPVKATTVPAINFSSIGYSASLRKIILNTVEPFQPSTTYTLTLADVFDCPGNALTNNSIYVVLPEAAEPNDILINEILFNPKPGGVDFIEVYNTTNKYIGLKKWSLANLLNGAITNPKIIEPKNLVMPPKSFLVFTTEPSTLKAHYPRTIEKVCEVTTVPSMPDDEGSVALVDSIGNVIDYFLYRDDYHVIFLKDKEGVSLERVSLEIQTNNANNWKSASQAENFATPGYKNSVSTDGVSMVDGEVLVEPEIFSPQVAPNDFAKISYRFSQGGFVANASIYDHQGRLIKSLANNEVLGTEGFFRWDGDRDDGGRARAGYYVAWVEVFNANGQVNTYRKRVIVFFR